MSHFPARTFKILSLDGGGIRGAFSASVLAELEETINDPLSNYFDLLAGTSTGAIIAAGIAFKISAREICDFYKERGPAIFRRRWWSYFGATQSRYSDRELRTSLEAVFQDRILEEASCRLLIPAINLTGDPNTVFKTPHQPGFFRDRNRKIVDVLMATTAAPSFFPQAKLADGTYADGGLWANNPSMAAYTEAVKIMNLDADDDEKKFGLDKVSLLSIGTGSSSKFLEPSRFDSGGIWWGLNLKLLDVIGRSQSAGSHFQTTYVLGNRYKRINFQIPPGERWSLDSVDKLDELTAKGVSAVNHDGAEVIEKFLRDPALKFKPYPITSPVER